MNDRPSNFTGRVTKGGLALTAAALLLVGAGWHGFAAETGAATVLMFTAHIGLPVSTTHTITSSVMGVGAIKRLSAVRWGVTRRILYAWLFTLPGAGLLSTIIYLVMSVFV